MKILVTRQQRENALLALNEMLPSIPDENIYPQLGYWWRPETDDDMPDRPHCGTVGCFGYWCGVYPPFVAQGVSISPDLGVPVVAIGYQLLTGTALSLHLFGDSSLFAARMDHRQITDKQEIERRLTQLIQNSAVADE